MRAMESASAPAGPVGGLELGDASLVDLNRLHREWYDWTMKGGPRPDFLKSASPTTSPASGRRPGSTPTT
jgi:hypothetical protein